MRKKSRVRLSLALITALVGICAGTCPYSHYAVAETVSFDLVLPEDPTDLDSGNYKLTANVNTPISVRDDAVVSIDLNGFTVNGGTIGSAVTVGDDAKLCLYDTVGTGKITGKTGTRHSSVVGGAGVYVNDDAIFEMYGGTITECEVTSTEFPVAGAGVYVKDGASFTMNGGVISKCRLHGPSGRYGQGAGVFGAGVITLSGGVIEDNGDNQTHGGGIYTNRSLIMRGEAVIRNNLAYAGGGVYLAYGDAGSAFEMAGGHITGNSTSSGTRGAGIFVQSGAVKLSGTADICFQADNGEDIRYSASTPDGSSGYRFCHTKPSKPGYVFEVHNGSRNGTDVTSSYESEMFRNVSPDTGLYIAWGYTGSDQTEAPSPTPFETGIPFPVYTPTPTPTSTATAYPTVPPLTTVTPVPTTEPTATPEATYGPGEGRDSAKYLSLSEKDRATADELVRREPTLSYVTAADMVLAANNMGVSKNELLLTNSTICSYSKQTDPDGASFGKLMARTTARSKTKLTISWKTQKNADGHVVYKARDDDSHSFSVLKSVGNSTGSFQHTGLKQGKGYKYIVLAYKNVSGARMTIAVSVIVHEITKGSKKYTTVDKLKLYEKCSSGKKKLESSSFSMKSSKTMKLTAKEIPAESGLTIRRERDVRYESMNPEVARVSASGGKITAVSSGKAVIYVYAQNGVYKKLTITVK
ncbi:MAG: Ig-like domain-containing protein [Eubacterium sp.]|nr:Ig-like domain-containing protein [Eubacterium sp.]